MRDILVLAAAFSAATSQASEVFKLNMENQFEKVSCEIWQVQDEFYTDIKDSVNNRNYNCSSIHKDIKSGCGLGLIFSNANTAVVTTACRSKTAAEPAKSLCAAFEQCSDMLPKALSIRYSQHSMFFLDVDEQWAMNGTREERVMGAVGNAAADPGCKLQ